MDYPSPHYLEAVLTENQKYPEVVDLLRNLRLGTVLYGEPLKTISRLISVKRLVESTPQRDEIARIILNTIALKGPQNISQLTKEVQHQRGKASRITVRKRVNELVQGKALIKEGNHYILSG